MCVSESNDGVFSGLFLLILFQRKASYIKKTTEVIATKYNGDIPDTLDGLVCQLSRTTMFSPSQSLPLLSCCSFFPSFLNSLHPSLPLSPPLLSLHPSFLSSPLLSHPCSLSIPFFPSFHLSTPSYLSFSPSPPHSLHLLHSVTYIIHVDVPTRHWS